MTRRLRLTLAVAVPVLLALVAAGFVVSAQLPPRQSAEVAVPADDAAPADVVRAYLAALDASDCDTAEALWGAGNDSGRQWCDDVAGLDGVEVTNVDEGSHTTRVSVDFDLEHRWLRGDVSLPDGPVTWSYVLDRDDVRSPWRIRTEGAA